MRPFCPLYEEAVESEPWRNATHPHIGLRFDKFADAWRIAHDNAKWEFDKGKDDANWMKSFSGIVCGDRNQLAEATRRQHELAEAYGGMVCSFKNTSRFITGIGRTHPAENGFAFHHALGVPYLPGSGMKGVLAAWLRETREEDWDQWLGTQDRAGTVIFLDLLPMEPPSLITEIMTPHYGPYYQDGKPPADWHSPVPIPFLAVETGTTWQLAILPRQHSKPPKAELEKLLEHVVEALDWLGAGAKTAIGHGRFKREEKLERKQAQRIAQEKAQEKQERERAKQLRSLSPIARELEEDVRTHKWDQNSGAQHFMATGCEEWLDRIEAEKKPPEDVCQRLAELVDHHFASGLLADPDRTQGKKKKPIFKDRQRKIAHRLRALPGVMAFIGGN